MDKEFPAIAQRGQEVEANLWKACDAQAALGQARWNDTMEEAFTEYQCARANSLDSEFCLWQFIDVLLEYVQENEGYKATFKALKHIFKYDFGFSEESAKVLACVCRDYMAFED